MTEVKQNAKEKMLRALFVALASKWEVHDRDSAKNLARHCLEMVDGFHDVVVPALSLPKKPEKPA